MWLKLNRIKLWESITNVCTSLDFEYSAILKCCKYEQIKSYGYTWFYEEDFENRYVLHKSHHNNSKQIALFDNKNYIIKKWKSLKEACKELNLKPACVSYRIKYNRLNPDGTKFTYI
jgi:hypothetical protein